MVPAAVLSSLVSMVVQLMSAPPIIQTILFAWDLKEELERLYRILLRIQSMLGDADERQMDEGVKAWLQALKDVAYDAEDILDRVHYEVMRRQARDSMRSKVCDFVSLHNPLLLIIKAGYHLKNITEKIEKIAAESRQFNFAQSSQSQIAVVRLPTDSFLGESQVFGRDVDKEKIVNWLVAHDTNSSGKRISLLSIVGMGGVGKTTLAQLVCNDSRVKNHFPLRMWICVSTDFDVEKLAKTIIETATEIKYDLPLNMEQLQKRSREVLSEKMYLLVLDDVWDDDQDKWEKLNTLLSCGAEGSKIVVTTRSELVSQAMDTVTTYHLSCLSEDDSWTLFRKRAFKSEAEEQQNQNLVAIGKDIVKKCEGLPLAVKTLGSTMRSKSEVQQWLSVKNAEIWDLQVGKDRILSPLMLSYGYLPFHLKQCFNFCAIFPKDSVMDKELLIQLWMANGFLPSGGGAELEVVGHNIFNELVWRSFLQDVQQQHRRDGYLSYTTCKMHGLMRDLAQSIMHNECFTMLEFSQQEVPKKIRHLSLPTQMKSSTSNKIIPFLPSLRTYIEREHQLFEISDTRPLHKAKSLRAVKLSDLPSTFPVENWKSLKYLDLSYTLNVVTLPESMCMLFNLQTLQLSECGNLYELPSGMRKMCNLRHLFIDGCPIRKMPSRMGQLSNLQTLTNYIVGSSDEGGGIGELKRLNLGGQLVLEDLGNTKSGAEAKEAQLNCKQSLHLLKLHWGRKSRRPSLQLVENSEEVLEALEPPNSLKILEIWNYVGIQFPRWMRDPILLRNMVEIKITNCNGCEHLPPFGHLQLLEVLILEQLDAVKYICSSGSEESHDSVKVWPSLKRLELLTMQNLEGWWEEDGCAAAAAEDYLVFLPCLTDLIIRGCPKLTTMPKCCPSIQNFEIIGEETKCFLNPQTCTFELHLEEGCSGSNEMQFLRCLQQNGLLFRHPKFTKHLNIKGGDAEVMELLMLNEEETGSFFTSLEKLSINGCNWLFSLEPLSLRLGLWEKLTALQDLRIGNCDALMHWPEEELRGLNCSLKRLAFTDCKNLAGPSKSSSECGLVDKLDSLEIFNCDELVKLPTFPASLGQLTIFFCNKLKSFTFEGPGGSLLNLKSLHISFCYGLVELPNFPASLRELEINSCHNLKTLLIEGSGGPLPDLNSLRILFCDGLVNLPHFPASLRQLEISSCPHLVSLVIEGSGGPLLDLNSLRIAFCHELLDLPKFPTSLRELEISGCPNLMSLVIEGSGGPLLDLNSLRISFCDEPVELPKFPASVRNLEISHCESLKSVIIEGTGESLQLQTLEIFHCPRLTCFSETLQQQLPKLQRLEIWECPNLERTL